MDYTMRGIITKLLLVSSGVLIGYNNFDLIMRSKNRLSDFLDVPPRYEPNIQVLEELIEYKDEF
jgi:hypothetical protein